MGGVPGAIVGASAAGTRAVGVATQQTAKATNQTSSQPATHVLQAMSKVATAGTARTEALFAPATRAMRDATLATHDVMRPAYQWTGDRLHQSSERTGAFCGASSKATGKSSELSTEYSTEPLSKGTEKSSDVSTDITRPVSKFTSDGTASVCRPLSKLTDKSCEAYSQGTEAISNFSCEKVTEPTSEVSTKGSHKSADASRFSTEKSTEIGRPAVASTAVHSAYTTNVLDPIFESTDASARHTCDSTQMTCGSQQVVPGSSSDFSLPNSVDQVLFPERVAQQKEFDALLLIVFPESKVGEKGASDINHALKPTMTKLAAFLDLAFVQMGRNCPRHLESVITEFIEANPDDQMEVQCISRLIAARDHRLSASCIGQALLSAAQTCGTRVDKDLLPNPLPGQKAVTAPLRERNASVRQLFKTARAENPRYVISREARSALRNYFIY